MRIKLLWAIAVIGGGILGVLAGTGCSTQSVTTKLTLPPRSKVMQDEQGVVLLKFDGVRSRSATETIRYALIQGGLHSLVNVSSGQAGDLKSLVLSKDFDDIPKKAPQGATILVYGKVKENFDYKITENKYEKCVKRDKKNRCTKQVSITSYTNKESCISGINFQIIQLSDGKVLMNKLIRRSHTDSQTQKNERPASRQDYICNTAYDKSMEQVITFITPYTTKVKLDFHSVEDPKNLTNKAINMVSVSNFTKARTLFVEVAKDSTLSKEDQAWAQYNLAISHWIQWDFDECVERIQLAKKTLGNNSDLKEMDLACREYIQ